MIYRIIVIISALLFVGCASNPMVVATDQTISVPPEGGSQVIFLRSSFLGSAINASLYDVTNGKTVFIGVIANGTKLSYTTAPGKHVFMVVSEAADFMEANLRQGKNYYSIVTPRMGAWKARFSLWPIKSDPDANYHHNMPEFKAWLSSTKLFHNSEKSRLWYEKNKNNIREKQEKYWPAWQQKSDEDIARRTLSPEDGI